MRPRFSCDRRAIKHYQLTGRNGAHNHKCARWAGQCFLNLVNCSTPLIRRQSAVRSLFPNFQSAFFNFHFSIFNATQGEGPALVPLHLQSLRRRQGGSAFHPTSFAPSFCKRRDLPPRRAGNFHIIRQIQGLNYLEGKRSVRSTERVGRGRAPSRTCQARHEPKVTSSSHPIRIVRFSLLILNCWRYGGSAFGADAADVGGQIVEAHSAVPSPHQIPAASPVKPNDSKRQPQSDCRPIRHA